MKKVLLSIVAAASLFSASAQQRVAKEKVQQPTVVQRTCGADMLPVQYETWIADKIKESAQNRSAQSVVYTIPVVVHVIHNGTAVGTAYNISDAQINSQIAVLNEDYRRLNADSASTPAAFLPVAADCEITFCLAQRDPSGNATTGIDRINRNTFGWSAPPYNKTYIDTAMKPVTIWDPTQYLNLWIVPDYYTTSPTGNIDLLGHATFPASSTLGGLSSPYGNATNDGVVVWYKSFGRTGTLDPLYNKGRTATHEIGHWLGLRHIWGDANCGTDYCTDTPTQQTANYGGSNPPYPCPGFPQVTCSNGPNGDMWMNYMDYCYDKCLNMFTANQKTRMVTALTHGTFRLPLLTSLGCQAPTIAAPVADFTANTTTIPVGGSVNFTDQSTNAPTSWAWTFNGGSPASSTTQNPSNVVYNAAGTYTVSLVATNGIGSDTETKTSYITVTSGGGSTCDTISNFDFSNDTATIYLSPDTGYVAGQNDFHDISKADRYTITNANTTIDGVIIFFGVGTSSGTGQTANVNVWDDGGTAGLPNTVLGTTTITYDAITNDAALGAGSVVDFSPDIAVPVGDAYIGVNFGYNAGDTLAVITSRDGNTMPGTAYEQFISLDWHAFSETPTSWGLNVAHAIFPIVCTSVGVKEILTPGNALMVYPNPSASGEFTLVVPEQDINQNININVYDVQGKLISSSVSKATSAGTYKLDLTNASKGVYMLEVKTSRSVKNQKISIN